MSVAEDCGDRKKITAETETVVLVRTSTRKCTRLEEEAGEEAHQEEGLKMEARRATERRARKKRR